jgi:hypothetical protein
MNKLEQYIKKQYQSFWQSRLYQYWIKNNSNEISVEEVKEVQEIEEVIEVNNEEVNEFECNFNKWLMGDNDQKRAQYMFKFSEYLYTASKGVVACTFKVEILKAIMLYYQEVILFLNLETIVQSSLMQRPSKMMRRSNDRFNSIVINLNALGVQESTLKILVTLNKIAFAKKKMKGSRSIRENLLLEQVIINNLMLLLTVENLDLTTEIILLTQVIDRVKRYNLRVLSLYNDVIDTYITPLFGLTPSSIENLKAGIKLVFVNYLEGLTKRYEGCLKNHPQDAPSNSSNVFFTTSKEGGDSKIALGPIIRTCLN